MWTYQEFDVGRITVDLMHLRLLGEEIACHGGTVATGEVTRASWQTEGRARFQVPTEITSLLEVSSGDRT